MKMKGIGVATLLATSVAWTPAFAADLGGDCCADLEERIAELEATTARKGNRKVSLTVSGQVNEVVYWWDDGVESNVYVGTSGYSSSRFRFKGDAKINADWSAGYYIEIEVLSGQVSGNTASDDDSTSGISLRQSNWYLKSKTLGTLTVGQQSHATDDIVLYSLAGVSLMAGPNHNAAPGASLTFRGSTLEVNDIWTFIDSDRGNLVRYDSPSVAGFVLSGSWGEDDMWDVALRYAGEFNGIKIAGGIGYHVERDVTGDAGYNLSSELYNSAPFSTKPDFEEIRGSISVLHVPTGLFVDVAGIHREIDNDDYGDFNFWNIRGGLHRKWFALGATTFFGEYSQVENSGWMDSGNAGPRTDRRGNILPPHYLYTKVDGQSYGFGIMQNIDAAAMELYVGWRRFEADLAETHYDYYHTCYENCTRAVKTDDIDTVYAGARIQF